jgi:hypothetical protein
MAQELYAKEELKKQRRLPSVQVDFLSDEDINCLMLNSTYRLKKVSEEEFSMLYNILQVLFRNTYRPFTPFYPCQECLDNLVREGLLFQIGMSRPEFVANSEVAKNAENKLKLISEKHYKMYREVISELARAKDRLAKLYSLERAAIAYEKLPEHLKIDFIESSGYVRNKYEAKRLLRKIERWITRCNSVITSKDIVE